MARLVGLPNGRVTADGSPGQTDDGRVARDFKLESTFVCVRRGAEREAVGRAVGAQLMPDTMVSLMLQSE